MRWLALALGSATVVFAGFAGCGGKTDGGDAGLPDAAGGKDTGSDALMCVYQDTRTPQERSCQSSADCVVVVRSVSCCKEENDGIAGGSAQSFDSQQTAQTAGCPACGCAAQPIDEQGNVGTSFAATCDNGLCTAHAQ